MNTVSPGTAAALTAVGALLCALQSTAQAPDPVTQDEVVAHVLQPQPVAPRDARLARLEMPEGFRIHRFAEGLENPRILRVAGDGTLYVTQRSAGNLVMLRDVDDDGVADVQRVVLDGIPHLHGLEIRGDTLYLAAVHHLWSAPIGPDGEIGELQVLLDDLPDAGQHPNRTMRFGPDGALYLSVGSTCNACREPNPENATLLRIDVDTGEREIFAAGLRNTIGFGWHPISGRLFGMDHNIDYLGDALGLEELHEIVENGRYGWPWTYFDGQQLRPVPSQEPYFVSQQLWLENTRPPLLGYTAHAAPMEMLYYTGRSFPAAYQGDAFVAMRGSWNAKPAVGYEIVRIRFDGGGEPTAIEPFVTGFLIDDTDSRDDAQTPGFLARPVGLAEADDGSLLMSDDENGVIYRIAYGDTDARPAPQRLATRLFAHAPETIEVRSPAFAQRKRIDFRFTDYGEGVSPPLEWSGVPDAARSLVLIMEDPRSTSPIPFVHWLVANLPPDRTNLPEGIEPVAQPAAIAPALQGSNSTSGTGYFGPRTPPGDGPHPYHFQVFALDRELDLPEGYNRHALLDAMKGHVIARGRLIARFAMPLPEQGIGPEAEEAGALLEVPGWDPEGDEPAL